MKLFNRVKVFSPPFATVLQSIPMGNSLEQCSQCHIPARAELKDMGLWKLTFLLVEPLFDQTYPSCSLTQRGWNHRRSALSLFLLAKGTSPISFYR